MDGINTIIIIINKIFIYCYNSQLLLNVYTRSKAISYNLKFLLHLKYYEVSRNQLPSRRVWGSNAGSRQCVLRPDICRDR